MPPSPLSLPPKLPLTSCTRGEPSPWVDAWFSSFWNTFCEDQRVFFSLPWLMTTMGQSASLCTAWPSCNTWSARYLWWWPGLGGYYMPLCRFSSWPSEVSMSLRTSFVIYSHFCNLPAGTPTGMAVSANTGGMCLFFSCYSCPTHSSWAPWNPLALKSDTKPSIPVAPTLQ